MNKAIRQLAAIMFTDMVGYTALMQVDEAQAKKNRDRQRMVLEKLIADYHGIILQYYGDGSLSVFGSAIEAVECAIEIQTELQRPPVIPLRIGLNVGDIVYENDGVYGDGVNIASRVESLCVPGAILISEKVYDEIRNHPTLPASSLGRYVLKNITRPVEIFALLNEGLTVPTPEELSGKTDSNSKTVAVLPFVNMSGDPENEYFSDGMTDELINTLTKIEGLQITSRTSSFAFKGSNEDIRQIGKNLNVGAVVEGSVRKSGDRIRVTVQLINTADGYHIWSEIYDRKLEDIFAIQDKISRHIANKLREKLGRRASKETLVKSYTNNMEAYNLHLKGNYYWNKWNAEDVHKAEFYYNQAVKAEPVFPLPYAGLSACYAFFGAIGYLPSKDAYPRAKEYALKSLALDNHLSESHLSLALVKFFFDWDWTGAEVSFKQALVLNPGSANAHQYYSMYLLAMRRHEEAIGEVKRAITLDPLSLPINNQLGEVLVASGRLQEGIEQYRKTLDLDSRFRTALYGLGWALWTAGEKDEAIKTFEQARAQTGHALKGITQLGFVYARTNRRKEAEKCLKILSQRQKLEPLVSLDMDFAIIYCGFRDFDKVFEHLENAYKERLAAMVFITGPYWNDLIGNPRYENLLLRLNLPVPQKKS